MLRLRYLIVSTYLLLNSDTLVAGVLSHLTHKTLCYCPDLSSQIKVKPTQYMQWFIKVGRWFSF
jgi:hypothetical protein